MLFSKQKIMSLVALLLANSLVWGQGMCEPEMVAGYNASSRIETECGWDMFVWGSFTYYQPIQENMSLGVVSDSSDPLDLVNGYEVDLSNKFKPGFKVGIGVNFPYDDWITRVEYTWFRGTEKVQKSLDPNNAQIALFPAWEVPNFLNPSYNFGSESWNLRMDLIDWDLARNFYVGKQLCFLYFIGLRYGLIRQNLDVDYINENPANFFIFPSTFIEQSSHSWGIGPRMGLSSNWRLCKNFRLYGNAELDLLFTQYDLRSKQTSQVAVANQYIVKRDDANYLRVHTELCLGLGWGSYFSNNRYHFDISADYSFQAFFDQNMFRTPVSAQAVGKSFLSNGNLYMNGLTVTARFDF